MFRRRTSAQPDNPEETLARLDAEAGDESQPTGTKAAKKSRPTPTRREAERLRKERLSAPKDRRELSKQTRAKSRSDRARARKALMSGDEANLPARDKGPVRAFARDLVDGRRSAAEFFLPGALVVLALSVVRNVTAQSISLFLWMIMLLLIVVDSVILTNRLSREVRRRFPDEPRSGLIPYALMRSMQIRRLRLPPPRVKPGRAGRSGKSGRPGKKAA